MASAAACLARLVRTSTERYAPSLDLLYSSMVSDAKAREVWDYLVAHCRQVLREAAGHLLAMKVAAPALDIDDVADRLWFCFGLAAWRSLVVDCGWSYDAAERLLAAQACDPAPRLTARGGRASAAQHRMVRPYCRVAHGMGR